ncbi:hypothetical protein CBS101457_005837 [Exobasidium rhododendri]|nr:hypothetical protein CBS101457_005837 [Exobasidium rhododendri]
MNSTKLDEGDAYLPTSLEPRPTPKGKRSSRRPSTAGTFSSHGSSSTDENHPALLANSSSSNSSHISQGHDLLTKMMNNNSNSSLKDMTDKSLITVTESSKANESIVNGRDMYRVNLVSPDAVASEAEDGLKGKVTNWTHPAGSGRQNERKQVNRDAASVRLHSPIQYQTKATEAKEAGKIKDVKSDLPPLPPPTPSSSPPPPPRLASDSPTPPPVPPKSPRHMIAALSIPAVGGPSSRDFASDLLSSSHFRTSDSHTTARMLVPLKSSSPPSAFLAPPITAWRDRSNSAVSTASNATAMPSLAIDTSSFSDGRNKFRRRSSADEPCSPTLGMFFDNDSSEQQEEIGSERKRTLSGSKLIAPLDGLQRRRRASSAITIDRIVRSLTIAGPSTASSANQRTPRLSAAPTLEEDSSEAPFVSQRRPTASSVLMVEGQMFEINDSEGTESYEARNRGSKASFPEDVTPLSQTKSGTTNGESGEPSQFPFTEEGEDEGVGSVVDDGDDGEVDDVAPPGAYAIHPPSKARLTNASALTLYDEDGNIEEFGNVFATRRTLICFLRHWFCPMCQMFSQSLQLIDPLPLEMAELDLVVVGQGNWHVTKSYKEVMKIPSWVRMYSDPSRKIYKALGMTLRTNDAGPACAKPDYQTMSILKASMVAIKKSVFDMPIRSPGDLKLLGGEFILGPGLQCSFTHRMVTTRGHLDLPRILVQAGCDLSLKTPTDVLEEQDQAQTKPGSIRSVDHFTSQRLRKLGRKTKKANGREVRIPTFGGDHSKNAVRALSGQHESQQNRTLPRTFSKKKQPPLPDVRQLNISLPYEAKTSTRVDELASPRHRQGSIMQRRSVSTGFEASKRHFEPYDNSVRHDSTSLEINRLHAVKPFLSSGLANGFSRSASTNDMDVLFTRPPKSPDRPNLPPTSSAVAFAAATARSQSYSTRPLSPLMQVLEQRDSSQNQNLKNSASVTTFGAQDESFTSIHDLQYPQSSRLQRNGTVSTENSENSYDRNLFTADTSFSRQSDNSNATSNSSSRADEHKGNRMLLSHGIPSSFLNHQSKEGGGGGGGGGEDEADQKGGVNDGRIKDDALLHSHRSTQDNLRMPSEDFEDDESLLKTPLARKISLEAIEAEPEAKNAQRGTKSLDHKRAWAPTNATQNRSSILAAGPVSSSRVWPSTKSNPSLYSHPPISHSTTPTKPAFNENNPLLFGLPRPSPSSPSTRAPLPASTPLFATLLAEADEAARSRKSSREMGRDDMSFRSGKSSFDHSRKSSYDQAREPSFDRSRRNRVSSGGVRNTSGGSFLDQLDVHESFQSRQQVPISSPQISQASNDDYDEYREDDEEGEYDDDDWAPLRASANAIPAGLSGSNDGDRSEGALSPISSFNRSPHVVDEEEEEDDEDYTDEEDEEDEDDGMEYESEKDLNRPSPNEVKRSIPPKGRNSRPVKANSSKSSKTAPKLYSSNSFSGLQSNPRRLSAFAEEEEEEDQAEGKGNEEEERDEEDNHSTEGRRTPVESEWA